MKQIENRRNERSCIKITLLDKHKMYVTAIKMKYLRRIKGKK